MINAKNRAINCIGFNGYNVNCIGFNGKIMVSVETKRTPFNPNDHFFLNKMYKQQ